MKKQIVDFFTMLFFFQLMEEANFAAEVAKLFQIIIKQFLDHYTKVFGKFQKLLTNHVGRKISL